jgi:Ca2+-binding EF-hand superfamily protein
LGHQKVLNNIESLSIKNPTEHEINDLMTQVDVDGSGNIDVDEFLGFMMSDRGFTPLNPFDDLEQVFRCDKTNQ